jgi:hypothetical protein
MIPLGIDPARAPEKSTRADRRTSPWSQVNAMEDNAQASLATWPDPSASFSLQTRGRSWASPSTWDVSTQDNLILRNSTALRPMQLRSLPGTSTGPTSWSSRAMPDESSHSRSPLGNPSLLTSRRNPPSRQSAGYRPIDETGNNRVNPTLGSAGTDLIRIAPVGYADGISAPSLPQDQSARAISNILNNQADPNNPSQDLNTVDQQSLSDFGYVFGQFMDHDMDLTPDGGASFPIAVAPGDPIGPNPLPFTRSQFDPNTGTSTSNPRQQVNAVTSFLDLSQVYGSDAATADALRTHVGGQVKTSPGGLLPYDNATYFTAQQLAAINQSLGGMQNQGPLPTADLFVTGDIRGNENLELTGLQTLFVRNHNRIASELHREQPGWSDEQLYQEARKINIAEYQSIIYNEWIPAVLGPDALPAYSGYDPHINPSISNEFSTVGFRFGHSLLSSGIERQGNNGLDIADVNPSGASIDLAQDFFDPNLLSRNGRVDPLTGHTSSNIGAVLKADADGNSQAMDVLAINDVRNLLFGNGNAGGQDLIARDIQRGRDNGLPDYNTMRVAYGLPPLTSFAQITSNVQVQKELQRAYGNVQNIDAFEGGLAEDHVPGSDVGSLFRAIMVDQFTRLRDGDRFFYLNEQWSPDELRIFQKGNTLTKIIEANTSITNLQSDVFLFKASISGTVVSDQGGNGHRASPFDGKCGPAPSPPGLAGATIELEDTSGNVLATTTTDSKGHYRFDQLTGVSATGDYTVSLVVPSGFTETSTNPSAIRISRGDINVSGVNFVVAPAR